MTDTAEIRERHHHAYHCPCGNCPSTPICASCEEPYPCETIQLCDEVDRLRVLPTRDEIAAKISNHLDVFDTVMNVRAESFDLATAIRTLLAEKQR